MCGINGLVGAFGGPLADRLELMNAVTAHRGPDDSGIYVAPDGSAGLGHRRLSILDLSAAGRQPMSDPDGQVHLVFNGEIYNFRELRTDLEGRGYRFRSQTDTEVLLYLYLADGERMLDRLNGIFSFAVWDDPHRPRSSPRGTTWGSSRSTTRHCPATGWFSPARPSRY